MFQERGDINVDRDEHQKKIDMFNSFEVAQQTLLTWIQSGLTLIGFGLAFGSIIAFLREEHYEIAIIKVIRVIGMLLILVGFISIILALFQYRHKRKRIEVGEIFYRAPFDISLIVGLMISLLGIIAFFAILTHMIF